MEKKKKSIEESLSLLGNNAYSIEMSDGEYTQNGEGWVRSQMEFLALKANYCLKPFFSSGQIVVIVEIF